MDDAIRLNLHFDPARMQSDLQRAADIGWTDHFVTRNYEGSWSAIGLRAPAAASHPVQQIYSDPGCTDFANTPILDQCPYFQEILAGFQCELHSVRLMRLAPGSVIKEHVDVGLDADEGYVRLHVPVTTNPHVEFYLNHRRVIMQEGECWYLRLTDPHSVINGGTTDRVHLVIDAVADTWIRDLLLAS